MEIIEKVNLLLDNPGKDALIGMLIEDAKTESTDYCNLSAYVTKLDPVIVKMVIQNYNKARTQGIASESFSGVSQSYINGYSSDIIVMLNKNRKLKTL